MLFKRLSLLRGGSWGRVGGGRWRGSLSTSTESQRGGPKGVESLWINLQELREGGREREGGEGGKGGEGRGEREGEREGGGREERGGEREGGRKEGGREKGEHLTTTFSGFIKEVSPTTWCM